MLSYQVFVHLDGLFEDRPNHRFITRRGGQGAGVAVVFHSVNVPEQVVDGDLIHEVRACTGAQTHKLYGHTGLQMYADETGVHSLMFSTADT